MILHTSRGSVVRLAMLENRRESSCRESIRPIIIKARITNTSSLGHGPSNPRSLRRVQMMSRLQRVETEDVWNGVLEKKLDDRKLSR